MKHLFLSFLFVAAAATGWAQELKLPALSPTARVSQDFSTSTIDLTYSRPSTRGRRIFGDLIPYGKVWRTGANSATKIKFGEDVTIDGQNIKAGEYALYTIPGKEEWEVIFNKGTGNWGSDGYETSADVARIKVKAKMLDMSVPTFTIDISNITFNTCKLNLEWEKTKITLPIKVDNDQRLSTAIDKAINNPNIPYQQAANYYNETDQHLERAYEYAGKAIEQNPNAFYLWYMKARIAKKLGKDDEAIAAAKKSMELAKGGAFEGEYKHNNEKLINEIKASKSK